MSEEATSLPEVTPRELQILLAGLDELPGKHSRVLYDKIVGHVMALKTPIVPASAEIPQAQT